ncbi:uncharacterized protein [Argopecten irradians]|uniref:uncharacterized protein n=1 Tax=Argopecten irradians TaxID=31199 RepID=UPI00371EE418
MTFNRKRIPYHVGVMTTVVGVSIYLVYSSYIYITSIGIHSPVLSHDSTLLSVFSAVMDIEDEHQIILNVWDGTRDTQYKCCVLTSNAALIQVFAKPLYSAYNENVLSARQYKCIMSSNNGHVTSVAMILTSKTCTVNEEFIDVLYPPKSKQVTNQFVIYSVLTRDVRPMRLIEWFEYYQSIGLDKIYLVLQLPDPQLMSVLSHYIKAGLLELKEFPFPLPGRSQDDVDRNLVTTLDDSLQRQLEQDTLVGILHCMAYLRGFGYVANIDVYDFVLTEKWRMLFHFLEDTFEKIYPNAAVVKLQYVKGAHFKSGTDNTKGHIEYKVIHIPGRISTKTGDLRSNRTDDLLIPHTKYSTYTLPADDGVVYHVGQCSAMWIICIKNHSAITKRMYRTRTDLERKGLSVASKLYLTSYHHKPR